MGVARLACAWIVALVATAAAQPTPQQRIALTAKPSVVRVWGAYVATYDIGGKRFQQALGGSGTGFFLTPDGYIATNAHVVSNIREGDETAKQRLYKLLLRQLDREYTAEIARMSDHEVEQVLRSIKLVELQKRAYIVLPNGDKLAYTIEQYGKPGSGRDAAILKVKTENAPTLPIGDSSRTQVADPIVVIGYPGVADMKVLLDEKSQLQASVTDGTISSLKRATSGEQILQISAPITHGNSGGPALDLHGNVVGLATFGNESEVQGFNFLVASATLVELVEAAKIAPTPSETNTLWKQGLEHYWAAEYTAAIDKFQQVESLFPAHSEAPELIRQSHQAKREGKEKQPDRSSTGLVVGLVVGGVVVLALVVLVLARRKKPAHAIAGAGMHGAPAGPHGMGAPHAMPGAPPMGAPHAFGGASPPGTPNFAPPQMPPPMGPPQNMAPPQQAPQMYGRTPQPAPASFGVPQQMSAQQHQPIAKTIAVQAAAPAGAVAPTALGSLSIGSLTCTRGQLAGQRFAITATGIIVGRQPGVAHVLVNDPRASGKHVWIGMDQGRLVAIDQGTTNGTYVNDVTRGRITRHELRDGDVLIIGEPDCLSLQVKLS